MEDRTEFIVGHFSSAAESLGISLYMALCFLSFTRYLNQCLTHTRYPKRVPDTQWVF